MVRIAGEGAGRRRCLIPSPEPFICSSSASIVPFDPFAALLVSSSLFPTGSVFAAWLSPLSVSLLLLCSAAAAFPPLLSRGMTCEKVEAEEFDSQSEVVG